MRPFDPFRPITTPVRALHRATHPLHLLRKHNAQAAAIGNIRRDLQAERGAPVSALPIALGGKGHPPGCACCGGSAGRRGYATFNRPPGPTPEETRAQIDERNARNALKSKNGGNAASAPAAEEVDTGASLEGDVTEADLEQEVARFVGGRLVQSLQREQPPRGSGIQPLLDYNKQWAGEIARLNNNYFSDLAQQQSPQYLWVGCSDSRVPANEIVGLYPGDVFVHRNIANIVCNSDLNALAVLQYAIDCLKVEHVIISGHYRCGGVNAALNEDRIGLADHWILHVSAVKKRHWKRMMMDIPSSRHLDALCELNVLAQVESVVETHLVQRVWSRQNAEDALARKEGRLTRNKPENEVEIHGWVYGLEDGIIRPLMSLTRRSNVERQLAEATDAVFWRYGQLK